MRPATLIAVTQPGTGKETVIKHRIVSLQQIRLIAVDDPDGIL